MTWCQTDNQSAILKKHALRGLNQLVAAKLRSWKGAKKTFSKSSKSQELQAMHRLPSTSTIDLAVTNCATKLIKCHLYHENYGSDHRAAYSEWSLQPSNYNGKEGSGNFFYTVNR
ncbi:uncharacterized protein AFUA_6G09380 [Aspergillus fumigatus Af293]|uniref:Uncharacterized protein n=2 Tax=Aspergillus fumigatus TaxID=746128 RepID=Q4WMM4_ASPFU|nr:hypothetical protein AFUA_6G09380 [Aspergillus fumigatus Af293]EAL88790.1 hypothetical protein AFUA_6G09380 [Aspergillus fumigatus Af293]EDP48551.1 hypothetical protein AFUB_092690 [Aspergillus fumigatus A1163]KEY83461.1 hypothetical protein BA78_8484 [Aspergillus fumigatus]